MALDSLLLVTWRHNAVCIKWAGAVSSSPTALKEKTEVSGFFGQEAEAAHRCF